MQIRCQLPYRLLFEDDRRGAGSLCQPLVSARRKLNDLIKRARLTHVSDSVCDQEQGRWTILSVLYLQLDKTQQLLQQPTTPRCRKELIASQESHPLLHQRRILAYSDEDKTMLRLQVSLFHFRQVKVLIIILSSGACDAKTYPRPCLSGWRRPGARRGQKRNAVTKYREVARHQ